MRAEFVNERPDILIRAETAAERILLDQYGSRSSKDWGPLHIMNICSNSLSPGAGSILIGQYPIEVERRLRQRINISWQQKLLRSLKFWR